MLVQVRESDNFVHLHVQLLKSHPEEEIPPLECETEDGKGEFAASAGVHYIRAKTYVIFQEEEVRFADSKMSDASSDIVLTDCTMQSQMKRSFHTLSHPSRAA